MTLGGIAVLDDVLLDAMTALREGVVLLERVYRDAEVDPARARASFAQAKDRIVRGLTRTDVAESAYADVLRANGVSVPK